MSCEVTKVCYRFPIPHLEGASVTEAYKFFSSFLGEASDIDYKDYDTKTEVLNFSYEVSSLYYKKVNPTEFKSFIEPIRGMNGKWGAEVIISIMSLDSYNCAGLQPEVVSGKQGIDFTKIVNGLENLGFRMDTTLNGKIYSYTWYNGVDEPISFE